MRKELRFTSLLPAILWFTIMSVLFFMPGKDLPKTDWWLHKIHFDKIVHCGLFFMLVVLFSIPVLKSSMSDKSKLLIIAGFGVFSIIWGIAVEFIQENFISERSFDIWDWVADSAGVLIALLVIRRIQRFIFR